MPHTPGPERIGIRGWEGISSRYYMILEKALHNTSA
jgi:hypothetical protein